MTWLRREDLEQRERRDLNPFAARSELAVRRHPEPPDPLRTHFQRDRDRIIHCNAFRRLQHKTQVLAAYEGDHYRSRMTHSLEVSQMSRAVSVALRLNPDLAEVVALAHDLGHPPFGHVGEEALHERMADHGGFRHNAQGLRIVDHLEQRYGHGHGLNLTDATRRSMLKGRVPDGFPLTADLAGDRPPPPLEAIVVDVCDRIAYVCHDLDDGLRAGVFTPADLAGIDLWRRASEPDPAARRSVLIGRMISILVQDVVHTTDARTAGRDHAPPEVRHGPETMVAVQQLLEFLRARFYRSERVLDVMNRGRDRLRQAFEHFLAHPAELPATVRDRIGDDGAERVVCDYVAGMTDRFVLRTTDQFPTEDPA